jgi:hypothetical protein
MLNRDQLANLYRGLENNKVLSVYVDAVGKDPAGRRVWRRRLEHELEREQHRLRLDDPEEVDAFKAAEATILKELDGFQAFLPGKGYVAFVTSEGIRHAESLPVQVPNLVRWETGPRVAPYIRGLKQLKPMVTALVDARRSRVFRYKEGVLKEVSDLRADTFLGDLLDPASPQRSSHYSGTRGETATDAAQRYLGVGTERMLKEVQEKITELAGSDGFVLLGGDQEAMSVLRPHLPKAMKERVLENSSLFVEMSLPEVKAATAEAASALAKKKQEALLDQILELTYARGNGCLGGADTVRALEEGRVDILVLSRSFVGASPDFADQCVGRAFNQSAEVRVLSGTPGDRLDAEGGGVGARLRYRVEEVVQEVAEAGASA